MTAPDAARRREQRRVARQLHPDLGGDPAAYVAAMAALRDRSPVTVTPTRRRRRTSLRTRLPRWVPGARRLIEL